MASKKDKTKIEKPAPVAEEKESPEKGDRSGFSEAEKPTSPSFSEPPAPPPSPQSAFEAALAAKGIAVNPSGGSPDLHSAKAPVELHMNAGKLSGPMRAALMRFSRWGKGQKITPEEYAAALRALATRPVGGIRK